RLLVATTTRGICAVTLGDDDAELETRLASEFPQAARAIGRACGSNRLALIVPCHRIVREDGSPGGWRWGVERKRQLLDREQRQAAGEPVQDRPG
ncbi:MAG TPA: methylated-DNA--[protein]-cysteine S-methyltransferase, partial [Rhodanobacter sp.]|nr:methylated-DNA--[protein]-cysteine S-methyltransferase [Rhodanobacter sp.]